MSYRFFVLIILVTSKAMAQIPVIVEPKPFVFSQPNVVKESPASLVNHPAIVGHAYSMDTQEANRQIIQEIEDFERQKKQQEQIISGALAELDGPAIEYNFTPNKGLGRKNFHSAFEEINEMFNEGAKLNLKRAVFLSEHAYDTTLTYQQFNKEISDLVRIIGLKMKKDKVAITDNMGKIMTLFQFMADTVKVKDPQFERTITTYPKTYDFEDFLGRQDLRKMFVSKLIKTGSGNCHSLPLLFLILAEEIGAEAYLAFGPNHSYIKFKDKIGNWQNIELTTGMIASDHFMVQTGYIKAEAIQSKIYLEPVSKERVISQSLNDLTMYYTRKYGYDDFVLNSAHAAINRNENDLTARQINNNYLGTLTNYIIEQYQYYGFTKEEFEKDEKAQYILKQAKEASRYIEQLGYSDMPADAYEAWIRSMEKEATKQEQVNRLNLLRNMIQH
jgi:hypothetical protein